MQIRELEIPDSYEITPRQFGDDRGVFLEWYRFDRLEEAVGEGRMGVAKSIVGRMDWLGGSAKLTTAPGCGTEWELTVPRR